MACNLTIDGIEVLSSASDMVTSVRVFGTADGCKQVEVLIECRDGNTHTDIAEVDYDNGASWEVIFSGDSICRCDELLTVKANCVSDPTCAAGAEFILECPNPEESCPVISNNVSVGDCVSGMRTVTVSGNAANLGSNPAEFEVLFAPGSGSGPITVPPSAIIPYLATHDYPGGTTQTVTIKTTQPGTCPPSTFSVDVPPCGGGSDSCPEITASYLVGDCDAAGQRLVSITYTVTNNTSGIAIVELEFAPGISGSANTVQAGTVQSFTETASLDPSIGNITPVVKVLYPGECQDVPLATIALDPCGGGNGSTCPEITINSIHAGCTASGNRTINFTVTVVNNTGDVVIVENEFMPGATGTAQVVADGATVTYTESYDYPAGTGPYTMTVKVLSPEGCSGASQSFFVKPCGSPGECTDPTLVVDEISGCAGTGNPVSVVVTADMGGLGTNGCSFTWDSGIAGSTDAVTSVPTHTLTYTAPGTYSIAVKADCGDCSTIDTATIEIPSCCPTEFESISTNVQGCVDDANTATVTGTVSPGIPGNYSWFVDGVFQISSPSPTSPAMAVSSSGSHTLAVEFVPDEPDGCEAISSSAPFSVPACGEPSETPGDNSGGDGEGGGCIVARWAGVILLGISIAMFALIACVPAAATGLAIAGGIAAAAAALIFVLWAIFCDDKPCKWGLLFTWQATLIAGLTLIMFMDCCPTGAWVGGGMVAAALALMATWGKLCKVGECRLMAEASIAISTAVLPVVDAVANIPLLNVCLNPTAEAIITGLAALLVAAVAACVASED